MSTTSRYQYSSGCGKKRSAQKLVHVYSALSAEYGSTGHGYQSCSWSAEKENVFLCPRSRLIVWSCETTSAVPYRVSSLILYTPAGSGAYSRDSSRFPRRCPHLPSTATGSEPPPGQTPEFIGSRNFAPMAFTAESPPTQGQ